MSMKTLSVFMFYMLEQIKRWGCEIIDNFY